MNVRVVIVTHNALRSLQRCLRSVRKWTRDVPYTIHVLDSASRDATPEYLRRQRARATVTSFPRNVGKAAAINHAVDSDRARSDWYAVLDDDAVVSPGWLSDLLAAARARPAASIVGCRSLYPDGRIYAAEMFSWFHAVGHGERDLGQRDYTRFCDGVVGVCALIRRDVFNDVRFWDAAGAPYEDSDFCFSARKQGRRVLYCGRVSVRHEHLNRHAPRGPRNHSRMLSKWGIRAFSDSHPLDKSYVRVWNSAEKGDWQDVLRGCARLRRADPVPAYAAGLAGVCLENLGRRDEARAAFQDALAKPCFKPAFAAWLLRSLASLGETGYNNSALQWRDIVHG